MLQGVVMPELRVIAGTSFDIEAVSKIQLQVPPPIFAEQALTRFEPIAGQVRPGIFMPY
jgi:hypothetical protein